MSKRPASEQKHSKRRPLVKPKGYQFFLFTQFLASAALLVLASDYLPIQYLIAGAGVLSLLIVLCSLLIFARYSAASRILGRFLSIILTVVLLGGSFVIYKSNQAIVRVTDNKTETVEVSIVVMKDSSIQKLSDLGNGLIGYNSGYDQNIADATEKAIQNETSKMVSLDPYSQYHYLADGLYYGDAEAIFFNEAYRTFFADSHPDFDSATRVLKTFSIDIAETLAPTAVADITTDCFIAYISGIDVRGEMTAKSRSDANLLMVANPTTHQILLLGIPRDYYVTIPIHGGLDKLTHSGKYGVNATIDTLELLLQTEINYYARMNFSAAIDIIDAMGGIDVYSPVAFTTLDDKYKVKEGVNHMDGDMALYFMRSRKMLKGGDNDRVANQIRVIRAVINELISFETIGNFNGILSAAENSIQTNLTSKEIQKLVQMQLKDMPSWDIQNYQLTGSNLYTTEAHDSRGTRTYVMPPNEDSVAQAIELINKMLANETISLEKMD